MVFGEINAAFSFNGGVDVLDADLNNSVQVRYTQRESSDQLSIGIDRYWTNGWFTALDASQEQYADTGFRPTTSQSLEVQKELRYPWLAGLYINRWDGTDAVSDTTFEFRIAWFGEKSDIAVLAGRHELELSATRRQGQFVQRDFVTDFIGVQLGFLPTENLSLSISATGYSHDFDIGQLNLSERPLLQLFLSPDTIATLGGLVDSAVSAGLNFKRNKLSFDVQASLFESTLASSDSQLLSIGFDYQVSTQWDINANFGRRFTDNDGTSDFIGIGARFSF